MRSLGAVMPAYNTREDWLRAALDGVLSQVDALVVVDDASTDGTRSVLAEYAERHPHCSLVCRESNGGPAAAINTGVASLDASHEWLTWVSTDNAYHPGWSATLLDAAADDVGMVYGGFWFTRGDSGGVVHYIPHDPGRLLRSTACYYGPSFVIRAEVWRAVGEHRGKNSHDYDHMLRVEEECWRRGLRIVGVPEPKVVYRAHPQRITERRRGDFDAPRWQKEARERREHGVR